MSSTVMTAMSKSKWRRAVEWAAVVGIAAFLSTCGEQTGAEVSSADTATGEPPAPPSGIGRGEGSSGQSATLLSSGLWLVAGGERDGLAQREAQLLDLNGNIVRELQAGLMIARKGHSASVMPDGRILIVGGQGNDGSLLTQAELFDPISEKFSLSGATAFPPIAFHTSTLLTDGRLLLVGGRRTSSVSASAEADIYDPRADAMQQVGPLALARSGHFATLLPDGRVLVSNGLDPSGAAVAVAEVYSPHTNVFVTVDETLAAELRRGANGPASVEATIPVQDSPNVSIEAAIAVRFAGAIDVQGVAPSNVTLLGPKGEVTVRCVVAEGGRLLFATPVVPLLPKSHHTLFLNGLTGGGNQLPLFALDFTTGGVTAARNAYLPTPQRGLAAALAVARESKPPSSPRSSGLIAKPIWKAPKASHDQEMWLPSGSNFEGRWESAGSTTRDEIAVSAPLYSGTSLRGRVLHLSGLGFPGIMVKVGSISAKTDANGNFILEQVPPGSQVLQVDGRGVSAGNDAYGRYFIHVDLPAGLPTQLGYPIWMAKLDPQGTVNIPSPTVVETVVSTPSIPGLELHLPAGSIIRDHEGNPVTQLNLTPIPVNQPPFALPNFKVPVYFTIQPGGATITGLTPQFPGARLYYPNYTGDVPGARIVFWNYDAVEKGWYPYGLGTTSADRRQVIPNPGVSIYELSGAMINDGEGPPQAGPPNPQCPGGGGGGGGGGGSDNAPEKCPNDNPGSGGVRPGPASGGGGPGGAGRGGGCGGNGQGGNGGDPVDLFTGQWSFVETDLFLEDVFPIRLSRTYRSLDLNKRSFGLGFELSYHIFQYSANQYQVTSVILPNSTTVNYTRTTPGTAINTAVFATSAPGEFAGSSIQWSEVFNSGWDLFFRAGRLWHFGLNAPIQFMRDRAGNELQFTRQSGATGTMTRIDSPNGRWVQFGVNDAGVITSAQDNAGRGITYGYDTNSRLTSVIDADSYTHNYVWNSSNQLQKIKTPSGTVLVDTTYDDAGRVSNQAFADGTSFSFAYDAGPPISTILTDRAGNERLVLFSDAGYVISNTYPLGTSIAQTDTYAVDATTNLINSHTDALGRTDFSTYDTLGNLTGVTYPQIDAGMTTFTYSAPYSQVSTATDPLGHMMTYVYDGGNLTFVGDALGHVTSMTYDTDDRFLTVTDPMNDTTTRTYVGADLASMKDPLSNVTTYQHDSAGRVVGVHDPLGSLTAFTLDGHDRITNQTDPLGNAAGYTFDQNGNLTTTTDPKMNATQYAFDSMNREVWRHDPLGHDAGTSYATNGLLASITDRKGQLTKMTYDARDRLSEVDFHLADGGIESTISYVYDNADRPTQITDSLAGQITRTYDALDNLLTETTPLGSVTYTYDLTSRRKSMTISGQTTVSYGYDNADRLTTITRGTDVITLGYDKANRRNSLTLPEGISVTYTYDNASRMTGITYKNGTQTVGNLSYAYDTSGHLVQKGGTLASVALPAAVASATYNANNQLTLWGTQGFAYDLNGNMAWDGTSFYKWNVRNQLVLMYPDGGTPDGGSASTFLYDAVGRRQQKTIHGTDTEYVYDPNWNIAAEYTKDGGQLTTVNLSTPLPDDLVCFYPTDGGKSATFLAMADSANMSIIGLISDGGLIQASYAYEPYGNTTFVGDAGTDQQYAGRENDGTGLYYNRWRYYLPNVGRFISEDPLGAGGGDNLYQYADTSPIDSSDPTGLLRYNKPPPTTVPPTGQNLTNIQCVEDCLSYFNSQCIDLMISGGQETSGHSTHSCHSKNKAVDIRCNDNNVGTGQVFYCAVSCGYNAGQPEFSKNHWHVQFNPGNGVPRL
jgi:RHS repeat-associated protein